MVPFDDGSDRSTGADSGVGDVTRPPAAGESSLLEAALAFAREHLELAWVPLATALFAFDDLRALGSEGGFGVHFSFPFYRADLWTFVQRPTMSGADVAFPVATGESVAILVPSLAAYVVVSGALTAGYFGSIADALDRGTFDFVANVRRYGLRMIALEVLVVVAFLALLAPLAAVPPLLVVAVVVGVVVAYYLFPTAYLVVLEDRPVLDAIERSVDLVQTHQPLGFVFQVALTVGACSILLTGLARSSVPGAITAAVLAAPLGLACNAGVMLKVRSLISGSQRVDGRARR